MGQEDFAPQPLLQVVCSCPVLFEVQPTDGTSLSSVCPLPRSNHASLYTMPAQWELVTKRFLSEVPADIPLSMLMSSTERRAAIRNNTGLVDTGTTV